MRRVCLALSLTLLLAAPALAIAQGDHTGHAAPAQAPATPTTSGHEGHAPTASPPTPPRPTSPSMPGMPGMPAQPQSPPPATQAGPPSISIGQDIMRAMGVRTTPVARQPLQRVIRATGRVEFDERLMATVTTKIEGWVEKLYADYTGKPVKKGEVLASLYSPEVMAVQFEYLRLLDWAAKIPVASGTADTGLDLGGKDAAALLAAARERFKLFDVGDAFIRQLEKNRRPIRDFPVVSPINGFVVRKMVVAGTKVAPGEKLFDLADLSTVWVIAEVYEYELPWVQSGRNAVVRLSNTPDAQYPAVVDYIYPTLSEETRTAKVRFVLKNPGDVLRPGMYARADIDIDLGERLVVPREAIIDTGERQVVYAEVRPGAFELREVKIGVEASGMAEITAGLKEGEKVATAAAFLIDSETRLKGAGAAGGHQH